MYIIRRAISKFLDIPGSPLRFLVRNVREFQTRFKLILFSANHVIPLPSAKLVHVCHSFPLHLQYFFFFPLIHHQSLSYRPTTWNVVWATFGLTRNDLCCLCVHDSLRPRTLSLWFLACSANPDNDWRAD